MQDVRTLLPPDLFEAVVTAFSETLVRAYRERFSRIQTAILPKSMPAPGSAAPTLESPWLRVAEAAKRARCARSTIYAEVQMGRLRSTRVGGGRLLRIRAEWVDQWLQSGTAHM
jgi:excisionase family DNA binding protein